jgi:L-seryl-tRNA(Ser) seleniumtransferase
VLWDFEVSYAAKMSNFYDFEFGIPTVINGIGTMTSLGGSRMDERVTHAMVQSSKCFVDINELHRKAGRRIAELCKSPYGYTAYVTTGEPLSRV